MTIAIVRAAADALGPHRFLLQLRDKHADPARLRTMAYALRDVTRAEKAWFVINGDVDLADEVGADGVHLPSDTVTPFSLRVDAVRKRLGIETFVTTAAHHDEDVRAAAVAGASGVLVSPIFTTPGKGPPRGLTAIESACRIATAAPAPLKVYALGGITAEYAAACAEAGASGVAVIRGLYDVGPSGSAATARALALPWSAATR